MQDATSAVLLISETLLWHTALRHKGAVCGSIPAAESASECFRSIMSPSHFVMWKNDAALRFQSCTHCMRNTARCIARKSGARSVFNRRRALLQQMSSLYQMATWTCGMPVPWSDLVAAPARPRLSWYPTRYAKAFTQLAPAHVLNSNMVFLLAWKSLELNNIPPATLVKDVSNVLSFESVVSECANGCGIFHLVDHITPLCSVCSRRQSDQQICFPELKV